MIELRGVSKFYGQKKALNSVHLTFHRKQTCALIGPSGCGKSTILRLATGLTRPSSGQVLFEGCPLSESDLQGTRRRIGYVVQGGGLFPHLTAAANASLMARHIGWPPDKTRRRLQELSELTHLPADRMKRYPNQLSGGERQRVSLIRALMLEPEVLLLDEPLGALDPLVRAELQEQLQELFAQLSSTVVLVTHDLQEAARLAQRLVLMQAGTVSQDGSWSELRDAPATPFVERFVSALAPRPL